VTTALDTNILLGLFVRDARTALLETHLLQCQSEGPLQISPVVFAETLARPGVDEAFLLKFLRDTAIQVGYRMDDAVWSLAGNRFALHAQRRRQTVREGPRRIIADFLIGAHAMISADRLMTLDTTVYKQDFPELSLYPISGL
jgi:predicted nucleic acid-binding protein